MVKLLSAFFLDRERLIVRLYAALFVDLNVAVLHYSEGKARGALVAEQDVLSGAIIDASRADLVWQLAPLAVVHRPEIGDASHNNSGVVRLLYYTCHPCLVADHAHARYADVEDGSRSGSTSYLVLAAHRAIRPLDCGDGERSQLPSRRVVAAAGSGRHYPFICHRRDCLALRGGSHD